MEAGRTLCSTGYGKPPWTFKGSALYQLHLVKAETARAFIPKELRLVEAFGYTLGGFFLANYEDSPAGAFDELVVIAGIVWNPPTSCAWAARVFVNSDEACDHGRKYVGLPSQVARFTKRITTVRGQPNRKSCSFLNMLGLGTTTKCFPKDFMDLQVREIKSHAATDICNIKLPAIGPAPKHDKNLGLAVKMSLPSFSGLSEYIPNLLKYSCHIDCRVRAVEPAKVSGPSFATEEDTGKSLQHLHAHKSANSTTKELIDNERNLSISVMLSKPLIALEFNCLKMRVEAPIVVANCSKSSLKVS
ncbi:protein NEOXANTHIN-DEFICIENT 1-like isoform X2 [Mangifera indica]|uniref:protein NEOXANTHIN-DEFICIENT 1-like isoform X2 n=1 Tax=Mangifera indica TaxID=29780 RepID=UPI001CF9ECF4|nr:protein NEOXANTHIN-DEFICIENT 1-like isoform X2 [Mangifera indica]